MFNTRDAAWLFFIGSLWGLSEVLAGEFLYSQNIPLASVWLSSLAIFLLSFGRGTVNKPGSSTIVGVIACIYRLANTGPFLCHLLGIFILGLCFDAAATLMARTRSEGEKNLPLVGVITAYGNNVLFAVVITYIIRYSYWVSGGLAKILEHVFLSGSLTAVVAIFTLPMGFRLGIGGQSLIFWKSRWSLTGLIFLTLLFWIIGGRTTLSY